MIFLGVDGGGTKTHALALDEQGNVIGTGVGGRSNYHSLGLDRAVEVVTNAARQALGAHKADMAVYCLAACDTSADEARLTGAIAPMALTSRFSVANDAFAVLRAGSSRPYGVSIICGTGFNACGIAPEGRRYALHSLGALTGDWGGGYSLGEAACAAVFRADEGRSIPTSLKAKLLNALSVPDLDTLTQAIINRSLTHSQVAALAPLVFEAADEGDEAARSILRRQADEIVIAAFAMLRRLDMTTLDVDVVLGGGVMHGRGPLLIDTVRERVAAEYPKAYVTRLTLPPVIGATLLAFDALAVPAPPLEKLAEAGLALA